MDFAVRLSAQQAEWQAKCAEMELRWRLDSSSPTTKAASAAPSRKRAAPPAAEDSAVVADHDHAQLSARKRQRHDADEKAAPAAPAQQPSVVPTWSAMGPWARTTMAELLYSDRAERLHVDVVDAPLTGGRSRSWLRIVHEHLAAMRKGRAVVSDMSAHEKLEVFTIPDDDPRKSLRGQRGVRLRAGQSLARFEFIGMFGGLLAAADEVDAATLDALPHNGAAGLSQSRFDAYAFDLCTPGTDDKTICISGVPPFGNLGGLINDYRGSTAGAPNVAFGELRLRFGKRTLPLVIVYALRTLTTTVELLSDYGFKFWEARGVT